MNDTLRIIACSVFRDSLAYLSEHADLCPMQIIYLPSHLHLYPDELKQRLLETIRQMSATAPCIGCLYGHCFADIDHHLWSAGIERADCSHCYELFLGHRRYRQIMADCPGTFFVEKELLLNFDSLCRIPLELDDPELRQIYFGNYRQVIYIRQPLDPDLTHRARLIAADLGLDLRIVDADYTALQRFLENLQPPGCNLEPLP